MGVHTRPVPVNILNWPKVRSLSLSAKFLYIYLYFCIESSASGCYLFGTTTAAALIGISVEEVEEILRTLQAQTLITRCEDTGEIYVENWPEWHLFKSTAAKSVLKTAIGSIKNTKMKTRLLEQYRHILGPENFKTEYESNAALWHGIYLHNDRDFQIAKKVDERFCVEIIIQAIHELIDQNQRVLPSAILKKLSPKSNAKPFSTGTLNSHQSIMNAANRLGINPRPGESYDELRTRIDIEIEKQHEKAK